MVQTYLFILLSLLIGTFLNACNFSSPEVQAPRATVALTVNLAPQGLAGTAPTVSTPGTLTAPEIFARLSPAITFIDTPTGTGSGVLLEEGYVATNAHVVWPFREARVVFPDGSEYQEAPVAAWDLMADLAILGPLKSSLTPATLKGDEEVVVGDEIYLIGYPGEVETFPQPTITRGLVSRLREWELGEITYLQVDAAITGGQSGGVLVSHKGEIIGISGFSFSEETFGLVASSADILPRLKSLIAGEKVIGFDERQVAPDSARLEHDLTLRNYWDSRTYIIDEPVGTVVDIEVEGKNSPDFNIFDVFGERVAESEDESRPVKSTSVTLELEAPYFIELFQFAEEPGDFKISSSHKLIPSHDPDDNARVSVGETLPANIDTPADIDYFVIDLEAGETIQIRVDSVMIDPWLLIEAEDAEISESVSDDDSGGGLFGLNSEIIYQAPQQGTYRIIVQNTDYLNIGGYSLSIAQAPAEATLTQPFASSSVPSPFGFMEQYKSEEHAFLLQYPADWSEPIHEISLCRLAKACFTDQESGSLIISEDDFSALGLGNLRLSDYVDSTLSTLNADMAGFKLISREQLSTLQGLEAELVVFTFRNGLFKGSQLIYLHEGATAFSATYLASARYHKELEPLIDYSFGTFRVREAGQERKDATYHLDQGTQYLLSAEVEMAIEAFTRAIELDPAIFDQDLDFPYTLLGGGLAYAALGEAEQAIELLEEGLADVEDIEAPDPQLADLIVMAKVRLARLQDQK